MKKVVKNTILENLAYRRTELAYERTVLSYLRTFASFIIFGIAMISVSQEYGLSLLYGGYVALIFGAVFGLFALRSFIKHRKKWKELDLEIY